MRVTRRQLRQLIREAIEEDKSGKGECPPDGCVQKRGKGWVVISNKTGECWGRSKREGGECTYYDTKKAAQSALKAYHMEESVMRITKRQLRQLLKEEIGRLTSESHDDGDAKVSLPGPEDIASDPELVDKLFELIPQVVSLITGDNMLGMNRLTLIELWKRAKETDSDRYLRRH